MNYDFSKITDLHELLHYSAFFSNAEYNSVPELFHYTDNEAKSKIVCDSDISLKLTKVKNFQDKNEGRHILNVYDRVCRDFLKQYTDRKFEEIMRSVKNDFLPFLNRNENKYVFCFSKSGNNKYLIDKYAHKNSETGCCIGLQAFAIEEFADNDWVNLLDVLYDSVRLAQSIRNVIIKAYQLKDQDFDDLKIIHKILLNQLLIYSLCYKSSEFEREEETRLVVSLPERPGLIFEGDVYLKMKKSALYCVLDV